MDTQLLLFSWYAVGAGIGFGSIIHAFQIKNWLWIPVLLLASVLGQHLWVSTVYLILYWIIEVFPAHQNADGFQHTQDQEIVYRWLRINSLEKQIKISPWPHLFEELSQLLAQENRYSEAEKYCRQALNFNPSSISLRYQFSKILNHRQQVEEAFRILEPVLDQKENFSFEMKALVAEIMEGLGRLEDSADDWKMLSEKSHLSLAKFQLARVLSRLGRTQEAVKTLNELVSTPTIDSSIFGKVAHEDSYWIIKGRKLLNSLTGK